MEPMISVTVACGSKRCRVDGAATAACSHCGKSYFKCEAHGGAEAARRSLRSHLGLFHPKAIR